MAHLRRTRHSGIKLNQAYLDFLIFGQRNKTVPAWCDLPIVTPQNHPTQGNSYHPQTSICRCLIHKKCRNPTKDSCTKKHTCDPLSPYVGIIQIRFRVKAYAYSQPACASTPFSNIILPAVSILTVVWYIFFNYPHHLRDDWLFSTIISLYTCITEMQGLFTH